jgi:rsbT co-antagonist protein RsbR
MANERNDFSRENLPKLIYDLLRTNAKVILNAWMKNQLKSTTIRTDLIPEKDLEAQSAEFFEAFINALSLGNLEDITGKEYDTVNKLLTEIQRSRTAQGFNPSETATYIFSLKDTLWEFLQKEYDSRPDILNTVVILISKLLDKLGLVTLETTLKSREEAILAQKDLMAEIGTPVLYLWESVLFLPIIGTVDSNRVQVIMENALGKISQYKSRVLIMDILGVPVVDTAVANHILKITKATKLMGCQCIITGISPSVAQTMVQLGIDLGGLITKSTLIDGVTYAFDLLRYKITRKTD